MIEILGCLIFINTALSTESPSLSPYSGQNMETKIEQKYPMVPKITTSNKEAKCDSKKLCDLVKYEEKCFIEVSKSVFDEKLSANDETLSILNEYIELRPVIALFGQGLCNIPYSVPSLLLTISEGAGGFEKMSDKDCHLFRCLNLKVLKGLGIRGKKYSPHSCPVFRFQRPMQAMLRSIVLDALLKEQVEKAHYKMLDIIAEVSEELKILAAKVESGIQTESLVLENILIAYLTYEFSRMIQEKVNFLDDELVKIINVLDAENCYSKVLILNFMLYFSFIRSILEMPTSKDHKRMDWACNSIEKTSTNIKCQGDTETGILGRGGYNLTANPINNTQNITRRLKRSLNQTMEYEKKRPPTAEKIKDFASMFLEFKLPSKKAPIKRDRKGLAEIFNQLESSISNMKGCLHSFGDQAIAVFKTQDSTTEKPASGISRVEPNPSNLFDEESNEAYHDPFLKETSVEARDFEESSSDDGYFYSCQSNETLKKEAEVPCYRVRLEKNLLKSKFQSAPKSSPFSFFIALVLILIAISMLELFVAY